MEEKATGQAHKALMLNTLAFAVCFGVWMLNGVLVTFLVDNDIFDWSSVQVGWLIGIPVLTGAIFRLPAGILTDKFGGKWVYGGLLLLCSIPLFCLSQASSFFSFALCSFGFGLTGVSFSIGVGYTSIWYPKHWQGRALGIFGTGNAGAALTTLFAPTILKNLTNNGQHLEGWRTLPIIYGIIILITGVLFLLFSTNKKPPSSDKNLGAMLAPLKNIRVWRFGLYYFLVFGCFVAFAQWLVPYFVNVYYLSLVTAGILASCFSFPSGVIRAVGGWMSDRWGARVVMFWVLGSSVVISTMLTIPKMDIFTPGKGVMAKKAGTVTALGTDYLKIDEKTYKYSPKSLRSSIMEDKNYFLPQKEAWQQPLVKKGDQVIKKQLLIRGKTHIFFQANIWVFAALVILLGSIWGIGMAAVYKHIPTYFPDEVGVVGGMVGVLGGLGGFFCPIIFGYLLEATGIWTTCWMFILLVSVICLVWMYKVVTNMLKKNVPELMEDFERKS